MRRLVGVNRFSVVGDKFISFRCEHDFLACRVASVATLPSAPSPSNQTQARFSGNPDPTGTSLLGAEAQPQPLIRVTDQQIVCDVAAIEGSTKGVLQRIRIP
jgi:hypothetical protein